jgi:hypothetical protein
MILEEYRAIRDKQFVKIDKKLTKANKTIRDIKPKNYITTVRSKDLEFEVTISMTRQVKLIRWLSKQNGTAYCVDIDKDNELNEMFATKYKGIFMSLLDKAFKQLNTNLKVV